MALSLYNLLKAILLLANAFVILNERFFRQIGLISPRDPVQSADQSMDSSLQNPPQSGTQNKDSPLALLIDQNVKFVLQIPLIVLNIVFVLFELLFG